MHYHHDTTTFNGLEFGIVARTYGAVESTQKPIGPTTQVGTRTVTEGGTAKEVPVTPTDVAKEAIKDGTISGKEQTAFEAVPATQDVVKSEQERLAEAVRMAEGNDHVRDDEGTLKMADGKPLENAVDQPTEHEQKVEELAGGQNADAIQERLDAKKNSGVTTGVELLQKQQKERVEAEGDVVDVIVDKTAYVGTLQAERKQVEGSGSEDAADDYQKLRTEAQGALEQFISNDGQVHEPDLFGDDWDNIEADGPEAAAQQFDELASQFQKDPDLLKEWVSHQGDSSDAIAEKDMEAHIAGIEDLGLQDKVAARYEAAKELQGIFERYNKAHDATSDNSGRIEQIDTEIQITTESIEADRGVLSNASKEELDKRLATDESVIDAVVPKDADGKPKVDEAAKNEDDSIPVGETKGDTKGETKGDTKGETKGSGADKANEPSAEGTETPAKIDVATPEGRQQVLQQAQERELLPTGNTTFNEQGQAVYTVQPGDSYWHIADMSDGQPPHAFDSNYFLQTLTSNSDRLGRDPQQGLIHPDEQLVLPGRSVQDLVQLLGLQATAA